jgi:hypothetical protein
MSSKTQLREEIIKLRATIHAAHDHIHNGRISEGHEALHCGANEQIDEALQGQNITQDAAARILRFTEDFNALCVEQGVPAAMVILVPSATMDGAMSIQVGGHIPTVQWIRHMMGKGPTSTPQEPQSRLILPSGGR